MATRQIVSYDDITLPYDSSSDRQVSDRQPPKKRKKNIQKAKQVDTPSQPSRAGPKVTQLRNGVAEDDMAEYEEESRELTHEEIWDDSALVDAWEAAQQEYEMYHGAGKNWKNETVKKSPLWYNIPVDQTAKGTNGVPVPQLSTAAAQSEDVEPDSQPLNFDTFVPTHDPSLDIPPMDLPNYLGTPAGSIVSQDEAFSRAMAAMYWGGYWTAMYHCQRHPSNSSAAAGEENEAKNGHAKDETEEET